MSNYDSKYDENGNENDNEYNSSDESDYSNNDEYVNFHNMDFDDLVYFFNIKELTREEIVSKLEPYIKDAIDNLDSELATLYTTIQNNMINVLYNRDKDKDFGENDQGQGQGQGQEEMMFDNFSEDSFIMDYETGSNNKESNNKESNNKESNNDNNIDVYYNAIQKNSLNPLTNQTEKRFIVIDTQFIQNDQQNNKSDFTINLAEQLKRVINIKLHSFSIPCHWYNVNSTKNNNAITFCFQNGNSVEIKINDGNYSVSEVLSEINLQLEQNSITNITATQNERNGKISFLVSNNNNLNETSKIIFFDATKNTYKNLTLGWFLGFRSDFADINFAEYEDNNFVEVISSTLPNFKGTKSIYIVVDDFKNNHVSSNVVHSAPFLNHNAFPNYVTGDVPRNIVTQRVLPSIPRTLTDAQIFAANELMETNKYNTHWI